MEAVGAAPGFCGLAPGEAKACETGAGACASATDGSMASAKAETRVCNMRVGLIIGPASVARG